MNNGKTKLDTVHTKPVVTSMFKNFGKSSMMMKFCLANHQEVQKPFHESKTILCSKCASSCSTNKCSYAYDNLAYGFSNDIKFTSEF